MNQEKHTQFPAWVVILALSALIIITFSVLVMLGTLKLIPEAPYEPGDPFTLYVLTAFNFVAFLIFSFILARMLLRLRRERRERRLGSRLKTRLVWHFIVISILPLTFLGLFSYLFINVTIEKWFGEPYQNIVRDAKAISEYLDQEIKNPPPDILRRAQNITEQHDLYEDLHRKQGEVRRTTFQVLGLITLLLLFAATWTAIHLAKGITEPVQVLAEATQHVARGDFSHPIESVADDELAILVDSFNRMMAELRENRRQIEASAQRLHEINLTLEERRRYIETVLESLSTGIISLDSENKMTTLNRAAMRILHLTETPAPQTTLTEALVPVIDKANVETIETLLRKAKRTGFAAEDLELESPSGSSHLVMTASALRDERGRTQGMVLMIEDITELVRAQRHAVWSEVARRMAHEIKNPLTPIQLSAERIAKNLERYGDALPDGHYKQVINECTATILGEVHTLERMVNEFTRFARLPQTTLQDASLNQVVEATIKLYEDRLNGLTIESRLDGDLPRVMLDAEQFKRALVNLIDNAIEAVRAAPDERRIRVETNYLRDQDTARVIVSDTGIGVDPKDHPRLFTPYFSRRPHGTGLGLAIVSRIVAEHQGRVRAENNTPRGARFIIDLPVQSGEQRV
jgi:PAS domain S-box-containing protein